MKSLIPAAESIQPFVAQKVRVFDARNRVPKKVWEFETLDCAESKMGGLNLLSAN
jgi:hypothetical protein